MKSLRSPKSSPREELTGSVAFINIPGLKTLAPDVSYRALVGLHTVLRAYSDSLGHEVEILSALTGAILVVRDSTNLYLHQHLQELSNRWAQLGIPACVGVAHGEMEVLGDVDGRLNVIGQPVNIAARLATQKGNPRCILHESYLVATSGVLDSGTFLKGSRVVEIKGKAHDQVLFRGRRIGRQAFPVPRTPNVKRLPALEKSPRTINAVTIGYDLPRFSAGDRSELSKRFRSVTDTFEKLRSEGVVGQRSKLYFSPGGDGGVLVLVSTKRAGFQAATRLARLLQVESEGRLSETQVTGRIGIHYGPVVLYQNAAGVERPTGQVLFATDALASDQSPVETTKGAIVLSELLADVVADGSHAIFKNEFEEIKPLLDGPAKGIKRFVRKAVPKEKFDTLRALTKMPDRWEPVR